MKSTRRPERIDERFIRRIALATLAGTSIEWYDFFLYGTAAALIFPTVFFPADMPAAVALFVQLRVEDTAAFLKLRQTGQGQREPARGLCREGRAQRLAGAGSVAYASEADCAGSGRVAGRANTLQSSRCHYAGWISIGTPL